MNKLHLVIVFMAGIIVCQAVQSLGVEPVLADSSGGGDAGLVAVAVRFDSNSDYLAVIDQDRHMAIYALDGGKNLTLLQARNISHDLTLDYYEYGKLEQRPTVKEVLDLLRR